MQTTPDSSRRTAILTWALAAAGFFTAALCLASLTNDGAYYLVRILQEGGPCVPHHRWLDHVIQAPILWALPWVSSPVALARVQGLVCSAVPLLSLAACLAMLRGPQAPLRMWAVFGILLAPLPGQIVMVGEVTPALQAGWVVLAFVWCGCPWRWAPVALLAGVAMDGLHPVSVALYGLAAATAFGLALAAPGAGRGRLAGWGALFAVATLAKGLEVALLATDYERANLAANAWLAEAFSGLLLTPFAALLPAYAAAVLEFRAAWSEKPAPAALARWRKGLWIAALALGLVYGLLPGGWAGSLCYRKFGILASAPLALLAGLEAWRLRKGVALPARTAAPVWPALLFAVTMAAMSLSWVGLCGIFQKSLAASPGPVQTQEAIPRIARASALNHWSATALSLLLQGWAPEKVHVWDAAIQRKEGRFCICPQDAFEWTDRGLKLSWIGRLPMATTPEPAKQP
ncbi:MAG: hypothetical protein ACFUZC_18440 [Chthoniobacteraceae bacterium]